MNRTEQTVRFVTAALRAGDPDLCGDARSMDLLGRYVAELVAWSAAIHLTGRARESDALAEQVCDSAAMLRCAEAAMASARGADAIRVADIGSGAGFPGIVWKIAKPGWVVTLIERRERIAAFLRRTVAVLGLEGVGVIEEDALTLGPGGYDVIVSKAAGRFSAILPIAERLGAPGSLYVTAKGDSWKEELAETASGRHAVVETRPMGAGRGYAIALRLTSL